MILPSSRARTLLSCRALSGSGSWSGPIASISPSRSIAAATTSFPPRVPMIQNGPARQVQVFGRQRWRPRHYSASPPALASTAQLVKRLREATGAPMMECKKALSSPEVDGDVEKAREWLRTRGSAKASSKVAGRDAREGLVGMSIVDGDGTAGSLVRVASETDFASRSEAFSALVQEVADAAAKRAGPDGDVDDIPGFLSAAKGGDGRPLEEKLGDAVLAIRENLRVDRATVLRSSSPGAVLGGYVHGRASPAATCGTSASLVEVAITSEKGEGTAQEAAKKLAMHVVAARPRYLDPSAVPDDVVRKEKEILAEKLRGSDKPPQILEKIVAGQLRKFYEGVCLTEQAHMVEEGNPKVGKVLKGSGLEAKAFRLMGMDKAS